MANERIQRQVDRLLDQIESAATERNWELVRELAENVLALEPNSDSAKGSLSTAGRRLGSELGPDPQAARLGTPATAQPTSFANGRYQVKNFFEGGKKRVYRAHDSVLDRDIALAVIKTTASSPVLTARKIWSRIAEGGDRERGQSEPTVLSVRQSPVLRAVRRASPMRKHHPQGVAIHRFCYDYGLPSAETASEMADVPSTMIIRRV